MKKELEDLKNLPSDWAGEFSILPENLALHNADVFLKDMDLNPSCVMACMDGGVTILFRNADKLAAIECYNSGCCVVALANKGKNTQVETYDFENKIERSIVIRNIKEFFNGK